jgi:hypothetical protein
VSHRNEHRQLDNGGGKQDQQNRHPGPPDMWW